MKNIDRPNKFLFSWDMHGIESIVPLNQFEDIELDRTAAKLSGEKVDENPIHRIVHGILMRARFNSQRYYEVYTVICNASLDESFWKEQWENHPQETANLIRDRGVKLFGERLSHDIKIR